MFRVINPLAVAVYIALELAPVSLDTTLFNGTEKERGS
jgi:hypothetical protein